jgi:hypothetical protein
MIVLFIRLLNAFANAANGLANLITALSLAAWMHASELEALKNWLSSTPHEQRQILQDQEPLSKEAEALFVEFQLNMDAQYQVQLLKRYILTLPSLPTEGF